MKPSHRGRLPLILSLVVVGTALFVSTGSTRRDPIDSKPERENRRGPKPVVILMIGDGMGSKPLEAASYYRTGAPEGLQVHRLPHRGRLKTVGLDGITDSAAAATAMATGRFTMNGFIAIDRRGRYLSTLVDLAHEGGLSAGIVTTSTVTHATPAAFTAHADSRQEQREIAVQQAMESRPEVLLGGGWSYFPIDPLAESGYRVLHDGDGLEQIRLKGDERLIGLFAPTHLPYERRRRSSRHPSLRSMALTAIRLLDRDPQGFFLMIEGGRIDMAGHDNDLPSMIGETIAFDRTVKAVAEWVSRRPNAILLVTADHDTGGMEILDPRTRGEWPTVRWQSRDHTEQAVDVFAMGPGTEVFVDALLDHRWIHAVARAHLVSAPFRAPVPVEMDRTLLALSERAE